MSGFDLPLFPPDAAALTVTTTVLVGVWVVAFFNLSFGWTLSGLVVPGYLVPLMMTKPWAAGVTLTEAIITYLIVLTVSERPRFLPYWCSFFGRDRFFALVLVSVLVRALSDGWALPWLGERLDQEFGIAIDYRNDLHSYGLIVVSLIANYFWKPGLRRGMTATAVTCGLTWLITRFVLVGLTNFNVGELQFAYDDIAQSLLASPKAYIVLITTAYLASWMNLRYSWEFNGILIPALLGLLWHEPSRVVLSICESMVVLLLGSQLLKLPVFKRTTMEGARKLLFFFTLCYSLRLTAAHLLPLIAPQIEANEVFGFGYLLTTLMAIKSHDKKLAVRLVRGTLQVSFMGTIAASLIGFALLKVGDFSSLTRAATSESRGGAEVVHSNRPLSEIVQTDKVRLYEVFGTDRYQSPMHVELSAFRRTLAHAQDYRTDPSPVVLQRIRRAASRCNYEVVVQSAPTSNSQWLYLRERSPARGWGMYALRLAGDNSGLSLQVPASVDETLTIEAGLLLADRMNADTLAIAGAGRKSHSDGFADVLAQRNTMFAEFHRACARKNTLQVRALGENVIRDGGAADNHTELWVSRSMPAGCRNTVLTALTPGFKLVWQTPPTANVFRTDQQEGFAELHLSASDLKRMAAELIGTDFMPPSLVGQLHQYLTAKRAHVARQGSDLYRTARAAEMLYFDSEILTPMLATLERTPAPDSTVDAGALAASEAEGSLSLIRRAANAVGYELTLFYDSSRCETFVVLHEPEPNSKHWGTFVFRWSPGKPHFIECPRPLLERHVFEFSVSLFDRRLASYLSLAGASPHANTDGTADPVRLSNKVNLLNLVRQVVLRETAGQPMLIQQVRAIRSPALADVVLATDRGVSHFDELSPLKQQLVSTLQTMGLTTAFVDGTPETAGYEVSHVMRAATVEAWDRKEAATLWLSPTTRLSFRDHTNSRVLAAQCYACDIPQLEGTLFSQLAARQQAVNDSVGIDSQEIESQRLELVQRLRDYVADPDVVRLLATKQQFDDWHWQYIADSNSGQLFLLVAENQHALPTVIRVSGEIKDAAPHTVNADKLTAEHVSRFVGSRATVLRLLPAKKLDSATERTPGAEKTAAGDQP